MPRFERYDHESWIEVDGVRAEEYKVTESEEGNEIIKTCYIEAREGAKFEMRGSIGSKSVSGHNVQFFADGARAADFVYLEKDKNIYCGGFDVESGTHSFAFGPMDKTSEESNGETSKEIQGKIGSLEMRMNSCHLTQTHSNDKGTGVFKTVKVFEDSKLAKLGLSVRTSGDICPRGTRTSYKSTQLPGSKVLVTRFKYLSRDWLERMKIVEQSNEEDNQIADNDDITNDTVSSADIKPMSRKRRLKQESTPRDHSACSRPKREGLRESADSETSSAIFFDLTQMTNETRASDWFSPDGYSSWKVGPTIILD